MLPIAPLASASQVASAYSGTAVSASSAASAPDFAGLEWRLTALQAQVRAIFLRLTGD